MNMDRRAFLKGGALSAAALAGTGLMACSPSSQPQSEAPANPDSLAATSSTGLDKATGFDAPWAFEIAPDPIPEDAITETVENDIIVVGAGVAGLSVAAAASEAGGKVTLISASDMPLARGGSFHAFNSKALEANGIANSYEGILGWIFQREMMAATWDVNQRTWYKFVAHSEEAMNWLIDKIEGAGYRCVIENFVPGGEAAGVNRNVIGAHSFMGGEIEVQGMGGPLVTEVLEKCALDNGTEFNYGVIARQLVRENNNTGRVSAVIAQRQDGSYVKYVGKTAIVLATGDFSADHDMMAKYCPEALPYLNDIDLENVNYNAMFEFGGLMPGDGQKMGLWIGAAWQKCKRNAPMFFTGGPGAPSSPGDGLLMESSGVRMGNEDVDNTFLVHQIRRAPGEELFGIWGSEAAVDGRWTKPEPYGSGTLSRDEVIAAWESCVEQNIMVKGNTIEEVIEQLGLPAEQARATVLRYNELAEAGADTDFYKRPELLCTIKEAPFYGMRYFGQDFLTVMGGLHTSENMEVLDEEDRVIEGLYNVGTMAGDIFGNLYTCLLPGFNLGCTCLTHSYLLGRALAQS